MSTRHRHRSWCWDLNSKCATTVFVLSQKPAQQVYDTDARQIHKRREHTTHMTCSCSCTQRRLLKSLRVTQVQCVPQWCTWLAKPHKQRRNVETKRQDNCSAGKPQCNTAVTTLATKPYLAQPTSFEGWRVCQQGVQPTASAASTNPEGLKGPYRHAQLQALSSVKQQALQGEPGGPTTAHHFSEARY